MKNNKFAEENISDTQGLFTVREVCSKVSLPTSDIPLYSRSRKSSEMSASSKPRQQYPTRMYTQKFHSWDKNSAASVTLPSLEQKSARPPVKEVSKSQIQRKTTLVNTLSTSKFVRPDHDIVLCTNRNFTKFPATKIPIVETLPVQNYDVLNSKTCLYHQNKQGDDQLHHVSPERPSKNYKMNSSKELDIVSPERSKKNSKIKTANVKQSNSLIHTPPIIIPTTSSNFDDDEDDAHSDSESADGDVTSNQEGTENIKGKPSTSLHTSSHKRPNGNHRKLISRICRQKIQRGDTTKMCGMDNETTVNIPPVYPKNAKCRPIPVVQMQDMPMGEKFHCILNTSKAKRPHRRKVSKHRVVSVDDYYNSGNSDDRQGYIDNAVKTLIDSTTLACRENDEAVREATSPNGITAEPQIANDSVNDSYRNIPSSEKYYLPCYRDRGNVLFTSNSSDEIPEISYGEMPKEDWFLTSEEDYSESSTDARLYRFVPSVRTQEMPQLNTIVVKADPNNSTKNIQYETTESQAYHELDVNTVETPSASSFSYSDDSRPSGEDVGDAPLSKPCPHSNVHDIQVNRLYRSLSSISFDSDRERRRNAQEFWSFDHDRNVCKDSENRSLSDGVSISSVSRFAQENKISAWNTSEMIKTNEVNCTNCHAAGRPSEQRGCVPSCKTCVELSKVKEVGLPVEDSQSVLNTDSKSEDDSIGNISKALGKLCTDCSRNNQNVSFSKCDNEKAKHNAGPASGKIVLVVHYDNTVERLSEVDCRRSDSIVKAGIGECDMYSLTPDMQSMEQNTTKMYADQGSSPETNPAMSPSSPHNSNSHTVNTSGSDHQHSDSSPVDGKVHFDEGDTELPIRTVDQLRLIHQTRQGAFSKFFSTKSASDPQGGLSVSLSRSKSLNTNVHYSMIASLLRPHAFAGCSNCTESWICDQNFPLSVYIKGKRCTLAPVPTRRERPTISFPVKKKSPGSKTTNRRPEPISFPPIKSSGSGRHRPITKGQGVAETRQSSVSPRPVSTASQILPDIKTSRDTSTDSRMKADMDEVFSEMDEMKWRSEQYLERLSLPSENYTPPRLVLICSKIPRCRSMACAVRKEGHVVPIVYDFETWSFKDITGACRNALDLYRKGCKAQSLMLICKGGPGYLYLLQNYVLTPQKLGKSRYKCMKEFWHSLGDMISKLTPDEAYVHVLGGDIEMSIQGQMLKSAIDKVIRPNRVKLGSVEENSPAGQATISLYFDYRKFLLWRSRAVSDLDLLDTLDYTRSWSSIEEEAQKRMCVR